MSRASRQVYQEQLQGVNEICFTKSLVCGIMKQMKIAVTGKGGVGKTSIACATAIQLAETGKQVLLVSTDPASNVGQVFGITIGNNITAVPTVANLSALEIDPQAAAQGYRDRIVNPVRGILPDDVVKGIEEQLSGACTTEIAAFDEFTFLIPFVDEVLSSMDADAQ